VGVWSLMPALPGSSPSVWTGKLSGRHQRLEGWYRSETAIEKRLTVLCYIWRRKLENFRQG